MEPWSNFVGVEHQIPSIFRSFGESVVGYIPAALDLKFDLLWLVHHLLLRHAHWDVVGILHLHLHLLLLHLGRHNILLVWVLHLLLRRRHNLHMRLIDLRHALYWTVLVDRLKFLHFIFQDNHSRLEQDYKSDDFDNQILVLRI